MKKKFLALLVIFTLYLVPVKAEVELPEVTDHEKVVINMFRGNGCSACYNALTQLINLDGKYDDYVEIKTYEVWYVEGNKTLLNALMSNLKVSEDDQKIPFFVIGDEYYVGYDEDEIFGNALKLYQDDNYSDYVAKLIDSGSYEPTIWTLENAAIQDGIIEGEIESDEDSDDTESSKTDTFIIIGIFVLVIGGFTALVVASNKK